jgi:hypothetical protein
VVRNLPKRHWEDGRHFHHNRDHVHSLADCFTEPSAWGGAEATYRPLSANLYYFAGRTLFGNRLEVYHAIDALVHVVNAVLLLLLCRELLPGPISLVPALLFVSRLAHEQDIAYTSNFDTLSYTAFGLAGVLLFVRAGNTKRRQLDALSAAAIGLSLLCKEAGIVWPGVVLAYGWLFDRAPAWRRYAAAWIIPAGWALVYPCVIHHLYPADQPGFVLDLRPRAVLGRYAAYLLSFSNALVPKVDPEHAGWAMPPRLAAIATTVPILLLLGSIVIVAVALMAWARIRPTSLRRPGRVVAFGLAWLLAAGAPFAILADRLFMRYSYASHAGVAIALGGLAALAGPAWRSTSAAFRARPRA